MRIRRRVEAFDGRFSYVTIADCCRRRFNLEQWRLIIHAFRMSHPSPRCLVPGKSSFRNLAVKAPVLCQEVEWSWRIVWRYTRKMIQAYKNGFAVWDSFVRHSCGPSVGQCIFGRPHRRLWRKRQATKIFCWQQFPSQFWLRCGVCIMFWCCPRDGKRRFVCRERQGLDFTKHSVTGGSIGG